MCCVFSGNGRGCRCACRHPHSGDRGARRYARICGYAADALNIQAFIVGGYNLKGGFDASWWHVGNSGAAGAFVGMSAKFSYALDGITPYIYIKDANFLADSFSMTIKPGFTTNVGCCAIELAVDITAASTIKVDVPVNFKVSF